jgi:hypothetical protein
MRFNNLTVIAALSILPLNAMAREVKNVGNNVIFHAENSLTTVADGIKLREEVDCQTLNGNVALAGSDQNSVVVDFGGNVDCHGHEDAMANDPNRKIIHFDNAAKAYEFLRLAKDQNVSAHIYFNTRECTAKGCKSFNEYSADQVKIALDNKLPVSLSEHLVTIGSTNGDVARVLSEFVQPNKKPVVGTNSDTLVTAKSVLAEVGSAPLERVPAQVAPTLQSK